MQILAAPGKASETLKKALDQAKASHVRFVEAPMVPQDVFDDVLLACDAALIRGEDSVLRAQLAGVPMIWTLYPQTENTHLTKLAAFAELYTQALPETARKPWLDLEAFVNNGAVTPGAWTAWRDCLQELTLGAAQWKQTLFALPTLAQSISKLAENKLKC